MCGFGCFCWSYVRKMRHFLLKIKHIAICLFQGPSHSDEVVEIVVAAQQLDPPQSVTPTLTSLLDALPSWVTPIGWTSTYTSWTF